MTSFLKPPQKDSGEFKADSAQRTDLGTDSTDYLC